MAEPTTGAASLSPQHREGCARLGRMRLKAARLNVYESVTTGIVDGVVPGGGAAGKGLRIESAAIQHVLNEQTDTASFRASGFTPVAGQTIQVYDGDRDAVHQLFGGRILETTVLYEERKQNVAYDLQCIDPTWLLQRRAVLGTYTNQSATAIVLDLVARFTRNVTTRHVAAGLPVIDAITFTNEQVPACLTALCQRFGGCWFIDYAGDLYVFLTETEAAVVINDANPRGSRNHTRREDLSQVATSIIGRGGGVGLALDLPAGSTELPIDEGDATQSWYSPTGGLIEINAQRVQYSGVRGVGGTGALVGTGNAPSAALVPEPQSGSSHTVGATYKYAATFTTAAGETLPGPLAPITIQSLTLVAPAAITARSRGPGQYPPGMIAPGANGQIQFAAKIWYRGGAVGPLGATSPVYTWDGNDWEVYLGPRTYYLLPSGEQVFYYPLLEPNGPPAPTNNVAIYRFDGGAPQAWSWAASDSWSLNRDWYYQMCAGYGGLPPATHPDVPYPPSGYGAVAVRGIPIAASGTGVTGRKLYRTVANGSALKLLATIANNADTAYGDTTADGALGAAPPVADTSAIKDDGQVLVGSTDLVVSATSPFAADAAPGTSGWIRVGSMIVRYTGIGAGMLTGIPASGIGAITATVRYGAQVLVQPRLVGVPAAGTGALTQAARKGDTATIRIEQSDAAAIAVMAERLKLPGQAAVQADGVIEVPISDSRFGLVELAAHVAATLTERKSPHVTITFESRDPALQVGRLVTLAITQPPINGTFRIQRITFTVIAISGGRAVVGPLRKVEATNKLYTFEDLLRRLRGREGGVP